MKRSLLALLLSLGIHAALLALLPADNREPVSYEVIRVTLANLPSGDEFESTPEAPSETPSAQNQEPQVSPPEPAPAVTPPPEPAPVITPPTPVVEAAPPEPTPVITPPPPVVEVTPPEPVPAIAPPAPPAEITPSEPAPTVTPPAPVSAAQPPGGTPGEEGIIDASRLTVTRRVAAEYPAISRRRRDQGTVVLILRLNSGRVASVEVEKSSGHSALDESAKRAASAWEFDVTGFGDTLSVRIPFVFSLTGR